MCSDCICRYQHVIHHDIWYVITLLLSLYGGLTVSLRLIVWNGLRIYQKFKGW